MPPPPRSMNQTPLQSGTIRRHRLGRVSDSILNILRSPVSRRKLGISDLDTTVCISKSVIAIFCVAIFSLIISLLFPPTVTQVAIQQHFIPRNASLLPKPSPPSPRLTLADYPAVLVSESEPFRPLSERRTVTQQSTVFLTPSESEQTTAAGIDADEEPTTRLIVLTMDRVTSLKRLLDSLETANYGEDHVDLDIWIDKRNDAPIHEGVLQAARDVKWKQGTKTIHKRTENAGLYQQWIYTWNITEETTEAAVILEDDLQVSPGFYQWLRVARAAYAQDTDVAAFTLQRSTLRPRQIRGVASGPLDISQEHVVFKYRLLGTWGFAPERDEWVEFRSWFEEMKAKGEKPYVDKLMTTDWYKSQEKDGFAPTMWSQWWIKFVDERNYFTVTAHLPDGSTLACNWREQGLHYSKVKPSADFPIFRGNVEQFVMPDDPILVDWDGREIKKNTTTTSV